MSEESQTGAASAELKAIVEALIFASPEPITSKTLFKLLADEPKEDIAAAVKALKAEYEQRPGLQFARRNEYCSGWGGTRRAHGRYNRPVPRRLSRSSR